MAHDGRIAVMTYMRKEVEDHRDPLTGEVNSTTLAEDACQQFDGYGPAPDHDIPDKYFEWAFLIAEEAEHKSGIQGNFRAAVSGLINAMPADYF